MLVKRNTLAEKYFIELISVFKEQNWDIEEFLENLCYKAGLASDAWMSATTDIFKFQAQIFQE